MLSPEGARSSATLPQTPYNSTARPCVVCSQPHRLFYCETFKSMKPRARFEIAFRNKLCYNCLLGGHFAHERGKQSTCTVPGCGKKHTRFIHLERSDRSHTGSSDSRGASQGVSNATASSGGSTVYLPIVPINVNNHTTYPLLDSGSTNTFMSQSLASRLRLQGEEVNYHMSTLSRCGNINSKLVSVSVSSVGMGAYMGNTIRLNHVMVIPNIPARYPNHEIDVQRYPHLAGLPTHMLGKDVRVDMLIGMDNSHLLMPLEIRCNPGVKNEPCASRTQFGWSFNGPVSGSSKEVYSNFVDLGRQVSLEQQVDNLWHIETNDSDAKALSVEDRKVLEMWDEEILHENGHYTVPIPWKQGRPSLPNNMYGAMCRLNGLKKRLGKADMIEKYDENISKMIEKEYAEHVPGDELSVNDGSVWYLPHHAVLSDAKPGKVRIVFDCSAKYEGVSLNNQCYKGPDLNNKLVDVILRFRQYKYAITADVEAMYLQVKIPLKDRNALRFLWFDGESIIQYCMTSHLFGGKWCASSSTFAMRRTIIDTAANTLVADTIQRSFYVDDMLKSVDTVEDGREVIRGTNGMRWGDAHVRPDISLMSAAATNGRRQHTLCIANARLI